MTSHLECSALFDADTVSRYVAGTLSDSEVEAFEIHLLTCVACQRDVRVGAAARTVLSAPQPGKRTRPLALWVVPLAAAAAVAMLVLRDSPLERLGRVGDTVAFEPLPIRAPATDAIRITDEGMAAYQAGNYVAAAEKLGEALQMQPSAGVSFFHGIALLHSGDSAGALDALALVVQADNAYAGEAFYYRAKAWLRLGEADSAVAQLGRVPRSAPLRARADALVDSIRDVR